MTADDIIKQTDLSSLKVLHYPHPKLREVCAAVESVDGAVADLVDRMFELMFAGRGVGLAAAQVGVNVRIFVASPTFDQQDRRVFINPQIVSAEDTQEGEEGCLSFPGISCKVKRKRHVVVETVDLSGELISVEADDLAARIYQHEIDHLDGRLLVDRMGSVAKLANRRALKELQEKFDKAG